MKNQTNQRAFKLRSFSEWIERNSNGSTTGFLGSGFIPPVSLSAEHAAYNLDQIEALKIFLLPLQEDVFNKHLLELTLVCKTNENKDWSQVFDIYYKFLGRYPEDVFSTACNTWIRTKVFFPSVCELSDICETLMRDRLDIWRKLRILDNVARNPAPGGECSLSWLLSVSKVDIPQGTEPFVS